jgi:hypothetical protein
VSGLGWARERPPSASTARPRATATAIEVGRREPPTGPERWIMEGI